MWFIRVAVAGLAALVGAGAAGCSDDCPFAACGGDPRGSWSVDSACGDVYAATAAALRDRCADADVHLHPYAGGTISFSSDEAGTYRPYDLNGDVVIGAMGSVQFPRSCFADQPIDSCQALDDDLMSCGGSPDTVCGCIVYAVTTTLSAGGTWSVDGSRLTLAVDGAADPIELEFCRAGDSLTMQTLPGVAPAVTYAMHPVIID